jgi:hypothetical protein
MLYGGLGCARVPQSASCPPWTGERQRRPAKAVATNAKPPHPTPPPACRSAYDDGGSDCEGDEGEGGEPAGPVGSNSSERTAQIDSAGGGSGAAGAAPRDGEEEGDDEALARRLHEEERRDLFSRMLAMSGYHQVAGAGEGEPEAVDAMSYEVGAGGVGWGGGGEGVAGGALCCLGGSDRACVGVRGWRDKQGVGDVVGEPSPPRSQDLQVLGDVVGVVSRGLSADAIAALPSVTVAQLQHAASGGGGGPLSDAARGGPGSSSNGSEGCPPVVEVPHRCSICLVDLDAEGARRFGAGAWDFWAWDGRADAGVEAPWSEWDRSK